MRNYQILYNEHIIGSLVMPSCESDKAYQLDEAVLPHVEHSVLATHGFWPRIVGIYGNNPRTVKVERSYQHEELVARGQVQPIAEEI